MVMVDNDQENTAGTHGELFNKRVFVILVTTLSSELQFPQLISFSPVRLFFLIAMAVPLHFRKSRQVFFTSTKPIPSVIDRSARAHDVFYIYYNGD